MNISSIKIGDRLREEMGDIAGLAESIRQHGLLHPIVVDDEDNLVVGARRLMACQMLGWETIPAKRLGSLTEPERREIELEENLRRKDLTAYERSKVVVELAATVRELEGDEETCPESGQVSKPARGPSREPDSYRSIEARTGVPKSTIQEAEKHVSIADQYPFMQSPDWKQYHVLEAGEYLERLSEEDRATLTAIASEPGVPPRIAVQLFRRMAEMKPEEKEEIRRLYTSNDGRDKSLAKTRLAELPPEPDPRQIVIVGVVQDLSRCIQQLSRCIKYFPDDPFTPRIEETVRQLKELAEAIRRAHHAKVRDH